jgi:hypothetical protein
VEGFRLPSIDANGIFGRYPPGGSASSVGTIRFLNRPAVRLHRNGAVTGQANRYRDATARHARSNVLANPASTATAVLRSSSDRDAAGISGGPPAVMPRNGTRLALHRLPCIPDIFSKRAMRLCTGVRRLLSRALACPFNSRKQTLDLARMQNMYIDSDVPMQSHSP